MYKWIAGSTCAATVLAVAVVTAQTYPQAGTSRAGTSRKTTSASRSAKAAERLTVTGCIMEGSGGSQSAAATRSTANASAWILSNASPSNKGTSAANQSGTAGSSVPGSTSATVGTSGTNASPSASSYQLAGITNPKEYSGKRVEITGVLGNARVSARSRRNGNASSGENAMPLLRVTSVRVLGETCQ